MNRRSAALTLVATLCLVAVGLGAPLLSGSARGFGEHVFQANPVVGPGDPYYGVYSGATFAQSIQVTQDYILTNVTLRVRNDGGNMNALVVSIHPDDPTRHVPVMSTVIASTSQVSPNNSPTPDDWNFPMNPSPHLRAGTVYWIVAENNAPQEPPTNGYEWHESNGDTYQGGLGYVLDPGTGVWTGLPYDLYFVTYGREWSSNVTLAMTANRAQAQPGDSVTFTVYFNNTGNQAAPWAWINTTVPAALANVSAGFPGIHPVSPAAFPNLTFQNIPNGGHDFTITGQIAIGTPPGTLVTNRASLDFQNETGGVERGARANASVLAGLATKQLYLGSTSSPAKLLTTKAPTNAAPATSTLNPGAAQALSFLLAPDLARPFATTNVSVSLWLATQKVPPQTYKLNVSLLDNGAAVTSEYPIFTLSASGYQRVALSFGPLNHTFATGHQIGLSLWSYGGGAGSTDNLLLAYNSTGKPSRLDLLTTTYISVDDLTLVNPATNGTTWSPLDPIVVQANVSDPFGSSRIVGAWINITSPTGVLVAAGAMNVLAVDASSLPSWIEFNYTLAPPLETGTYRVDVKAMEDNGVVDLAEARARVAVPVFSFTDVTSVDRTHAGTLFAYYLYYNNTGTGPAGTVWINETLPAEVSYAASSIPFTSFAGNRYTWVLNGVPVGDHLLEIDVSVLGSSTTPAWIEDNATLTCTDASGHPIGTLASHAFVFLNGPILTVSLSSTPAGIVHANETVVYTVALVNTGMDSGTVWLNNTLPSGFLYVTDTAANLGGTMTQVGSSLQYQFPGIGGSVAASFNITVVAPAILVRNSTYVDTADLSYVSTNGYLMPPETANRSSLAVSPWFPQAGVAFLAARASPGGDVPAVIRLWNEGNEVAAWAWINLTLDVRLGLLNATSTFTSGPGGEGFVLQDVGMGLTTIYLNFTVDSSTLDGSELQIIGTLEAQDVIGNALPTPNFTGDFVLASAPSFTLSVTPTEPVIEAGAILPLAIVTYNLGSSDAAAAWLNLTLPGSLEYMNDTSGVVPSVAGSAYSWHWTSPSPGLQARGLEGFTLSLRARAATPNGTSANIAVHLDYEDANRLPRPGVNVTVHALVVGPTLVLTMEASLPSVLSGNTLNYTIRIANRGATLAHRVWVEDDLDPRLELIAYASAVQAIGNATLNWTYADLAPGQVETINLTVRVQDGIAAQTLIAASAEANYTNSAGAILGSIRSLPVTIRIDSDVMPLVWILAVAAACTAAVVFLLTRREHAEIEEVFLVYRDGVLISHLSRTLLREKDEDVLSGMLTAVQEFVREAFQYGEHRELHQLDFGDYRILIERGKYVYLAVVYSGEDSPSIHKRVRTVIDLIEKEFGAVLAKWDGDMEEVVGARDLIRDTLLGSNNHNHVAPSLPEYE